MSRSSVLAAAALAVAAFAGSPAGASGEASRDAGAAPEAAREMLAIRFHEYGGPDRLRLERVPVPVPGPGQVLVEVHAASVNPIDWKLREGEARNWWPLQLPSIPGRDAAGVVRAVGEGVSDWRVGDEVVAVTGSASQGSYAEYVVVPAADVGRKPSNLTFVEAASYPVVALTAWIAVRLAEIGPGDTLLVHGGSGGVGSFVVQLATMRGARVIATASARNHEAVKQLGAVQAIDHRTTRFEDVVRDVDAVIDTVGTETLARSAGVLERRGRLVGMSGRLPADACRARALECRYVDAANEDGALAALAQLFEQGKLRVRVDRVFTLADAAAAQEANRAGGGLGKIVVRVRDGG